MDFKHRKEIIMLNDKVKMLLTKERNRCLREFAEYADKLGLDVTMTEIDHNDDEFRFKSDFMYINGDKIPYIRITGDQYEEYYVRNTGLCYYASRKEIFNDIEDLKLETT